VSRFSLKRLSLASGACCAVALAALACLPGGSSPAAAAATSAGNAGSWLNHDWVSGGDHNIWFLGNRVGVGLSNPSYKLDVRTLSFGRAVYGRVDASSGTTTGVYGYASSTSGRGVVGVNESQTGTTYGGRFDSHSTNGRGLHARAVASSGSTRGVIGQVLSRGSGARGVLGIATAPADAVYAQGDLVASGVKAFEIDHPLDPANKWLRHYVTESPEPMNAYSGNAVLDARGSARIILPQWFESINRDFRYQLTPVGAPSPDLHVASGIEGNTFVIAGGTPGAAVSWRVEAARNDLYVRTYGAPAEIVKPAEARNLYLHPELYNLPPERGVHFDAIADERAVNDELSASDASHSGW